MKSVTALFLIIVANSACDSHAFSIGSPHAIRGEAWEYQTWPAIFSFDLYKSNKVVHSCKGAVVSTGSKTVWITAAECLDKERYDRMEVKYHTLGRVKQIISKLNDGIQIHPDYNPATHENNIAIITPLVDFVDEDPALRAITLPSHGENFIDKEADLVYYKSVGSGRYEVQAVQAQIYDPEKCTPSHIPGMKKYNVCAAGLHRKGVEKSDTGIPLVVREDDDTFKLVGIAPNIRFWAIAMKDPLMMEFLNVDPYIDWIESA